MGNEWNFPPLFCIIGFLLRNFTPQRAKEFFLRNLICMQNLSGWNFYCKIRIQTVDGDWIYSKVHLFYRTHTHRRTHNLKLSLHNNCTQFCTQRGRANLHIILGQTYRMLLFNVLLALGMSEGESLRKIYCNVDFLCLFICLCFTIIYKKISSPSVCSIKEFFQCRQSLQRCDSNWSCKNVLFVSFSRCQ